MLMPKKEQTTLKSNLTDANSKLGAQEESYFSVFKYLF